MSYLPTSGLSEEQVAALVDIDPDRLRSLELADRVQLAMRHEEVELAKKDSFWTALQGASVVLIPLAVSIGLVSFLRGKKR